MNISLKYINVLFALLRTIKQIHRTTSITNFKKLSVPLFNLNLNSNDVIYIDYLHKINSKLRGQQKFIYKISNK